MARACIICSQPSVAGRSRCSKHGPTSPTGQNSYGAEHQRIAKQVLSRRPLICHICGGGTEAIPTKGPFQADHVVARSQGGSDLIDNYAPAHRHCNIAKGGANRKRNLKMENNF